MCIHKYPLHFIKMKTVQDASEVQNKFIFLGYHREKVLFDHFFFKKYTWNHTNIACDRYTDRRTKDGKKLSDPNAALCFVSATLGSWKVKVEEQLWLSRVCTLFRKDKCTSVWKAIIAPWFCRCKKISPRSTDLIMLLKWLLQILLRCRIKHSMKPFAATMFVEIILKNSNEFRLSQGATKKRLRPL